MNKKHIVEGMQNICLFPYCYPFKDHYKKTHDSHIGKISNFFILIFFNDFHWFSMTLPGKMSFIHANIKFHDFSRQDWNSLTFPGLYEPRWWLLATRFAAYPGCRGAHLTKRSAFYVIKILCIEYILGGIPTIASTFDVANMVKTATVKDVPINNDALLNIQAC